MAGRRQTPRVGGSVIVERDGAKSQKAMTTKGTATVDSTGSLSLAQLPPKISLTSSILASIIRLPPDPLIAYTIFQPSDTLDPSLHLSAVESARRSLVSDSRSILKSLLFTVKILPRFPLLYVFAISSSDQRSPPHDALLNLNFDGLICMFHPPISSGFSLHLLILLPKPLPALPFHSKDCTHAALPVRLQMTHVQTV